MNQQLICKDLLVSYLVFNQQANQSSVIFLHGWRSNKEIWQPIISKVSGQNIYAIDLAGFGQSQKPAQPFSVGDYANVVAEFIGKLGIGDVSVVGHSFGGRVGIKLAAEHPQMINKLVLVDAAGFAMDQTKKNIMANAAKLVKPIFHPKFMHGLRKHIYKIIGAEDYVLTPELQQTFVKVTAEDLSKDMKNITCPTLIITGQNDSDTPLKFGQRMHTLIPNSQFLVLPGAGHFSFLDRPEEFIKSLNQFLQHG